MIHVNLRISGKVQGVFYRASTKEKADELGINGFVKNEFNDNVYAEAEGNEEQINKFIEWCKIGPPRAKVEKVEVTTSDVVHFKKFEVRG